MTRTIIAGGKVVLPAGAQQVDILVENEKIAGIGKAKNLPKTDNWINAKGKLVLPGLIDMHVHFMDRFMGTTSLHDFFSGTRAAAFGGITTIIDFANQKKGGSLADAIKRKRSEADGNVVIDYGVHAEITDPTPAVIKEVRSIIRSGVPSFKVYTIYEGMMVDDGALVDLFEQTGKFGGLVILHAENNFITQRLTQKYLSQGKTSAIYHALSKPNIVESEAINRIAYLAECMNAPFYIVHMSTREGRQIIQKCQQKGQVAFAETCTHYLCLTDSVYKRRDGYPLSAPTMPPSASNPRKWAKTVSTKCQMAWPVWN
jgi:dihydropyrimidinase